MSPWCANSASQPDHQDRPRQDRALWPERRRYQQCGADRDFGGDAATQVVQQEKQFDLIVRLERNTGTTPKPSATSRWRRPADSSSLSRSSPTSGDPGRFVRSPAREFRYMESSSRRGTRPGRRGGGRLFIRSRAPLPCRGATIPGLGVGPTPNIPPRADQLKFILPLTFLLIFLLLFALYGNFEFPVITLLGVVLSAPVSGLLAFWMTHTPFSVSSGVGFLALFGVSVQTAVVYISYVNELRRTGAPLDEAIRDGAILRLRPIMMTALVAALDCAGGALDRRWSFASEGRCAGDRQRFVHPPSDRRLPDAGALTIWWRARVIGWRFDLAVSSGVAWVANSRHMLSARLRRSIHSRP